MANRKNLKKDLNWLTQEVIADALLQIELHPEQNEDKIADVIRNIITKRQEIITKMNMPTSKIDKKEVKKLYTNMVKDLLETTHTCFEDLSKLPRK